MDETIIELPLDVELPRLKELQAGALHCFYDNGNIRSVFIGDQEIVRFIYAAVRDRNWETAPYTIANEVIEAGDDRFLITYTATYQLREIHYQAKFRIEGCSDNSIRFSMKGEAISSFYRNRIGICVHHPIAGCAGKRVAITMPDGNHYQKNFPSPISPHQPFKDVHSMRWSPMDGLNAELLFEGEIFETEDQRNWTDSSFKTYCTPLDLDRPALVNAGDKIEQSVALTISGEYTDRSAAPMESKEIKTPMPSIGFCRPSGSKHLTDQEIRLLRQVPFDHYRVIIDLEKDWQSELIHAVTEARLLQTMLDLVVILSGDADSEVAAIIASFNGIEHLIDSILILHHQSKVTPETIFARVYPALKAALNVPIGYGTDANFAELNRQLPASFKPDFLSFSINPQVHAFDTLTLIENLETQHHTLQTLALRFPDSPVHVSPITLKRRYNPDAITGAYSHEILSADPRQHTNFTALWMLHATQNLAEASLTFDQTVGARGLVYTNPQTGEVIRSSFYNVLAQLAAFKPKFVIKSNTPFSFFKDLVFENEQGKRLIFKIKGA